MKPGDLVTLSAYGQRLLMFVQLHNKVGLVVKTDRTLYEQGSYEVRWQGHTKTCLMERKDIKKAK